MQEWNSKTGYQISLSKSISNLYSQRRLIGFCPMNGPKECHNKEVLWQTVEEKKLAHKTASILTLSRSLECSAQCLHIMTLNKWRLFFWPEHRDYVL